MRAVYIAVLSLAVGCAGTDKQVKSADDESAPPPPSQEQIEKAKAEQKEKEQAPPPPAAGQPAPPAKKLGPSPEKTEHDALVAKWEEMKKAGPITQSQYKSLAGKFASAARGEVAAAAHFNAGTLYGLAGDDKEAESEYKAALQANQAYSPAIGNLGELYYRTGSPQRAKEWFEKAIQADPTHNAAAYNNLALVLYLEARESGNTALYKEAVSKLRRALAIDSDSMAAYSLLALIYYTTAENDRSKLDLAKLVVDAAKDTNKNYAPIYNTMGLILLKKRRVSDALKEFEKAVALDPTYVEAQLNIGAIALSSRQYDKAQKAFEAVLARKSDSIDATVGLGVALRGQKKYDDAEAQYKKAAQLDPKNCAVPYNLGLLYQDYKADPTGQNANLKQAQEFYRQYASCSKSVPKKVEDANRRIKDIDDTFAALEQQKKMEAELKQQQEEMEKQQKEMEEKMKQQQQQQQPEKK
jgi:tetratricopeptide (TPR) repeat protein